jgi:mRNA interferase MazF
MTNYLPGDVVLVLFPFSDAAQSKQRPALIVFDQGDQDVLVARVTSHAGRTAFDISLADWKSAGLLAASYVRADKLATVGKQSVSRKLGSISPADRQPIAQALRRLLAAW